MRQHKQESNTDDQRKHSVLVPEQRRSSGHLSPTPRKQAERQQQQDRQKHNVPVRGEVDDRCNHKARDEDDERRHRRLDRLHQVDGCDRATYRDH
jgi:hypothetical protein